MVNCYKKTNAEKILLVRGTGQILRSLKVERLSSLGRIVGTVIDVTLQVMQEDD